MMKGKSKLLMQGSILLCMVCLILDSACAAASAGQAIELCLKTVIPSLFPMCVLSGLMVSCASGDGRFLRFLEEVTGLPRGCGILFGLGLVGGFPVGAQCISQCVKENGLSKEDARRMLGFCNQCSPAFLFGITGSLFQSPWAPWLLFFVQAECAILVAAFWPGEPGRAVQFHHQTFNLTAAVQQAIRSMASVCAWVVLARVLLGFLSRWIFPLLPDLIPVISGGLLELTSGVLGLQSLPDEKLRLILCSGFINWGGVCVLLQIQSIAASAGLSMDECIRQKLMQGALGMALCVGVLAMGAGALLIPGAIVIFRKKMWKKTGEPCIIAPVREGSNHAVP